MLLLYSGDPNSVIKKRTVVENIIFIVIHVCHINIHMNSDTTELIQNFHHMEDRLLPSDILTVHVLIHTSLKRSELMSLKIYRYSMIIE